MKRLVMTLALTSVLSVSAMAGDMPTTDSFRLLLSVEGATAETWKKITAQADQTI